MNSPFQSVGIIFLVTIVHVVAIAVYSSRTLPETTFQKSIVIPDVDSLEVMPEQLISDHTIEEVDEEPESCLEHLEKGVVLESESDIASGDLRGKKDDAVKADVSRTVTQDPADTDTKKVPSEETVVADAPPVIKAERWEDSDFAKRVSLPHLDGILGKKSKKLAGNKPAPAPKEAIKSAAVEPAPRSRKFSPVPRS